MKPTPKLRWIERRLNAGEAAKQNLPAFHAIQILQQWWEQSGMTMNMGWGGEMPIGEIKGEWRDVPMEAE